MVFILVVLVTLVVVAMVVVRRRRNQELTPAPAPVKVDTSPVDTRPVQQHDDVKVRPVASVTETSQRNSVEAEPVVATETSLTGATRMYRVTYRAGLIGALAGESLNKALARVVDQINADECRVVFLVKDRWSIWWWIGALLLVVLTLGLVARAPGYLVIAERRVAHDAAM